MIHAFMAKPMTRYALGCEINHPRATKVMAGMSLLDLPSEILREVCINFCLHCSHALSTAKEVPMHGEDVERKELIQLHNSSLSSLCRTSRQLNAVATPILYHGLFDVKHYAKFMRSLKERPALALFIKQITIDEYIELDPRDQGLIDEIAGQLGISIPERFIIPDLDIQTEDGDRVYTRQEFLVDLCLSQTVNISELSLNYSLLWRPGKSILSSSTFPSLKTLRLVSVEPCERSHLGVVTNLLKKSPNIESLEVYRCTVIPRHTPLYLRNLKSPKLRRSSLAGGMLRGIANSCKNLSFPASNITSPKIKWTG